MACAQNCTKAPRTEKKMAPLLVLHLESVITPRSTLQILCHVVPVNCTKNHVGCKHAPTLSLTVHVDLRCGSRDRGFHSSRTRLFFSEFTSWECQARTATDPPPWVLPAFPSSLAYEHTLVSPSSRQSRAAGQPGVKGRLRQRQKTTRMGNMLQSPKSRNVISFLRF